MTKRATADQILEAIVDLHSKEQIVTRETLANVTGMKLSTIDDRLGYLHDNGLINRVQRGVYVPSVQHPPARIITRTALPDGTNSLEIGDDHVIKLTPRETRLLGELFASDGQRFASIQLGHQVESLAGDLAFQLKTMRRDIGALQESAKPTSDAERKRIYRKKQKMSQTSAPCPTASTKENQEKSIS